MRLSSILTAILVAVALYLVILERPMLRALANGEAPVAAATEAETEAAEAVSVVVAKIEAQEVQNALRLSGRTEAARTVEVRSETTGQVVSDPIRKGAEIAEGDVLCQLDPGTREASLTEAQARLSQAELDYRAAARLSERGFSSETETMGKQAVLQGATAAVEAAETEIERLTIHAPFDGVLETDTAELGSLLQPGSPCAVLIALDPIKLVAYVPEQDVERLQLGAPAGGRLITGQEVRGAVSFLARSADEVTRTFRLEIALPNPDRAIRDGVSAEILVQLPGETGHLVPQSSLTLDDDGRLGVRVNEAGTARFQPVRILRDASDGVWVAGLEGTAEVIVVGQDFVRDGSAIEVSYRGDGA